MAFAALCEAIPGLYFSNFKGFDLFRFILKIFGLALYKQFILFKFVCFDEFHSGIVLFLLGNVSFLEDGLDFFVSGVIRLLDSQIEGVFQNIPTIILNKILEDNIESPPIQLLSIEIDDLV